MSEKENTPAAAPAKGEVPVSRERARQGRRKVLRTILLTGGVLGAGLSGYLPLVYARTNRLRPPGALDEKDFLSSCIKCGQCVQVCPVSCIPVNPDFTESKETLMQKYLRLQAAAIKPPVQLSAVDKDQLRCSNRLAALVSTASKPGLAKCAHCILRSRAAGVRRRWGMGGGIKIKQKWSHTLLAPVSLWCLCQCVVQHRPERNSYAGTHGRGALAWYLVLGSNTRLAPPVCPQL